jgi:putative oxidoreductase
MLQYKLEILEWLVRVFTGVIFLFQGYDKLFKVKIRGVVDTFYAEAELHHIPRFMVTTIACYTSLVEFLGGIALLLGLYSKYVLLLLGFDLVLAALAFSVVEAVWDMRHVFPRMLLVAGLLLMPDEWSLFSIDHLLTNK